MISILILTHNDEPSLPAAIKSIAWSDDIIIFDALSTDRTLNIAQESNARIIQRSFDNEIDHRAAALKVDFKNPWVFILDANETAIPRLREEMVALISDPRRQEVAYRARHREMFLGKWIKHSSLYPNWQLRLFRPEKVTPTPGDFTVDGKEGILTNYLERHRFAKGIRHWLSVNNAESTAEAQRFAALLSKNRINWRGLLSTNWQTRRHALKELSFHLPFRSFWIFMYLMVLRRGVLDGPPGWTYCRLRAHYNFMVQAKLKELQRLHRGEPPG
jgi:glycosyltransferase involved in cell wall biosynthesis